MNKYLGFFLASALPLLIGTRGKARLNTLIYHRVLSQKDPMRPYEVDAEQFEWQMQMIQRFFNPLSLEDALKGLECGSLPERAICVTFDDGYADNYEVALPILKKYKIPAAVFISTDFLNGGRMWNDTVLECMRRISGSEVDLTDMGLSKYKLSDDSERYASALSILKTIKHWPSDDRASIVEKLSGLVGELPSNLMLSDRQIVELYQQGVTIGAHTCSHPILENLNDVDSRREIASSKEYLERLLNADVKLFAYPNGQPGLDFSAVHMKAVRELGFEAAFSTQWGVASENSDRWQLARFTPWDLRPLKFMLRLILNYRNIV